MKIMNAEPLTGSELLFESGTMLEKKKYFVRLSLDNNSYVDVPIISIGELEKPVTKNIEQQKQKLTDEFEKDDEEPEEEEEEEPEVEDTVHNKLIAEMKKPVKSTTKFV